MTVKDILDFEEMAKSKGLDLTLEPNMNEPAYVSEETREAWEQFKKEREAKE